ncbi:hypothetical protein [Paenibacillus dendritiformis]|uniref:hypothetical protein n=1 Tax=Paenibacillus dendritiformis TaxID=130049 RepID=UPI000DA9AD5C|nr:hypothetical protein [Paenibacillus dendritiformis]PZM64827.1 hypothetical protein DOE73_14810 [Paenibacillus dendritiformis]
MSLNQWTHLYRKGFSQISTLAEQVEHIAPESADVMLGSLNETNRKLLKEVRAEKEELEHEIKHFLAMATGKLSYLKSMENHLVEWDTHFEDMKEGAAKIAEGGERLEEKTRTDADRQSG